MGYNTYGYIALYGKTEDNIEKVWYKQHDSIELLISNEEVVYIFNSANLSLEAVDFYHGSILNTYNLIWEPEIIVVDKKYIGCLNDRRLYVLNL